MALSIAINGENLFITGGGGVGKSYITNLIAQELENLGKNVLKCASTGKAAIIIGGETCHHLFKIPLRMTWKATPKLTQDSPLFYADTIIIDEVSMLRIDVFNFIVKTLEYVNNSPQRRMRPHIQLIIVGDFFQLPPVMPFPRDGSLPISTVLSTYYGYDVGNGYAFHSMGWKKCNFTVCIIKKVVRQKDAAMINALSDIRYGLRDGFTFFQGLNNSKFDKTDAIFLCGKKASAEEINRKSLNKLSSPEHIYYSKGTGNITNDDKQAPDLLTLKEGAHVILLQNTAEYQNGSSGIIVNLYKKSVDVKICATNKIVNVTYATWNAVQYFQEHYNQPLSIKEYAAAHNLSEGWFIQNFKQYTNSTPAQYLLSLRIHNAKVLLESTNYNVTEISNIIGYENPLYFSRIFKKQTGFSPSEYRKKIFSEDNSTHSVSIISPD